MNLALDLLLSANLSATPFPIRPLTQDEQRLVASPNRRLEFGRQHRGYAAVYAVDREGWAWVL